MKRLISVLLVLLFCSAAMVMAAGQKEPVETGTVGIELWSLLTGDRAELLDSQVQKFNESQSEVAVTVVHQGGYNPTKEKITAAVSAGNLPPLIMVDYMEVPFYAQQGVLAPLDGFISSDDRKDFLPGLLKDIAVDGKLFALPYNRSTQGLYINKDLMAKAGIEAAPETWTEFRDQALKIKDLGGDYYYGYSYFHQWFFDAICYTWGNSISTDDGVITFNDKDGVEMMRFFQQMQEDGFLLVPPTTSGGFEEQKGAFVEGKAATIFESTSWLNTMSNVVEFDWEFAFIPAGDGGHAVTIGGGNFALTSQTGEAEKKAAAKFLHYIANADQSAEFHMNTGYLPTRYSVLELPEVKAFYSDHPEYLVSVEQTEYARPSSASTRNIKNVWWRMTQGIQRILLNGEDVQTVLNEIAGEFQTELDELKSAGEFVY